MKKKLTYRMYGFVPYNISEIQKGIQFGHAVVEYANKYGKTKEYQQWAKHDKTFIILNGGPVNNKNHEYGMLKVLNDIKKMGVKVATFHEPDLNDALSAFVFLVDERIFHAKYTFDDVDDGISISYAEWVDYVGGKKNVALRSYLSKFRLA